MDKVKNIIYKSQNEDRKCFYIGYATYGLSERKSKHKNDCFINKKHNKFYNFLRKYGWDSFSWEVLAVYSTPEELPPAEMDWLVKQKKEFSEWECLNLTEGGDGYFCKGRNHWNFGNHLSKETKQKISKKIKTHYEKHPEAKSILKISKSIKTKEKMKKAKEGKPLSSEHRSILSKKHLGKHHSEETKEKIRLHQPNRKGENNPMFGRKGDKSPRWGSTITKETLEKMKKGREMSKKKRELKKCFI